MENQIQVFSNSIFFGEIRTALTENNEPLFCLSDVCQVLDLIPSKVAQRLDKDVLSKYPLMTAGGVQQVNFVNEDGLYDVILDSRKPEAKAFRKWITLEVLPSIRKNGGYLHKTEEDSPEVILSKAVLLAQRTIENMKTKQIILEAETERLSEENIHLRPKAEYTEQVLLSTNTYTFTQISKDLNYASVHKFLADCIFFGIIYKQSNQYLPVATYSGQGYFSTRTSKFFKTDGSVGTSITTVITEKGRQMLHDLIKSKVEKRASLRSTFLNSKSTNQTN